MKENGSTVKKRCVDGVVNVRSGKDDPIKMVIGALCGFLNGFFGGGGGMLVVPLLKNRCSMDEKCAHASAVAVVLPITIVSAIINSLNYGADVDTLVPVTVGSVVGGVIGALLLKKLNNGAIKIAFSIAMIAAGVRMVFS